MAGTILLIAVAIAIPGKSPVSVVIDGIQQCKYIAGNTFRQVVSSHVYSSH